MLEIYVSGVRSRAENYMSAKNISASIKRTVSFELLSLKSLVSLNGILKSPDSIELDPAIVCLKTAHCFRMIPLSLFALTLSQFYRFCICGGIKGRV